RVYVASKGRAAEACGFHSLTHALPATTGEAELLALVAGLNADRAIHGILVQLPLPKAIDATKVLEAIDPAKDVDGFHPLNVGLLATGQAARAPLPCTPHGALLLARAAAVGLGRGLAGMHAVVVGRSNIVGKPMAQLLLAEDCTVTLAHSRTRDLAALCKSADLLVAAVGRPRMLGADCVKPGAIVLDVGINRVAGEDGKSRLAGDVDFAAAAPLAGAITPVPGGVGPMTIAMLMANALKAAEAAAGRAPAMDAAPGPR
ncbi:MAG: bifunctional methylenetetrahydrofolate dehydrogenase/methenyltetrahydrofolate cyclohydrolase, partial [Hyphomicrobiales bacterium]|nr:bifunctional methylenetetrahydrofolate dehydrogenase/methenyltetrahydrofolate cyclohydrolase [Hyphomicrobiales bacterium]